MPSPTQRILLTCALPYANGPLHLGHLVEYVQADIYARFLRLLGKNVVFCCADDTHGTPIELKAHELHITPEQLIARYYEEHTKDFKDFLISFDEYYTTNSPENKRFSDLIFNRLKERDLVYKKIMNVIFCSHCKRFLPDRYVKGTCPHCRAPEQYGDVCEKCGKTHKTTDLIDPFCSLCNNPPVVKESMHYFFKLSAFEQKLSNYLLSNKNLQPEIVHFVMNWVTHGLEDWCISRDGPYFGFKIPGEESKYYYVWLDAPIGYIASTAHYCQQHTCSVEEYWNSDTGEDSQIIHVIGKDIVYFHFLFWPAMLLASDFKVPDKIMVHGFLTVNKEKMSKSRGTFITARQYLDHFNPEYLRYYYASHLTSKPTDLDLDLTHFAETINNQLVANIANFAYRVVSFLNKNFKSTITAFHEPELVAHITPYFEKIKQSYEHFDFAAAVKDIGHLSSLGNKYFQDAAPWKNIIEEPAKAHAVLSFSVNLIKNLSILLSPVVPRICAELQHQLNLKNLSWNDLHFNLKNHTLHEPKMLVAKLEHIEQLIHEEFPLDLRVGEIISVEDHPSADKLYVLKVNCGTIRQLVAGIKEHYSQELLLRKHIVVVANLKPAQIRGVESQGMLLAALSKKQLKVLEAPATPPGSSVYFTKPPAHPKIIAYEDFAQLKISVTNKHVEYKHSALKTDQEDIIVDMPDGAHIG